MPELPEVEILRRYFSTAALQQKIVAVEFLDHLNKIFKTPQEELEKNLVGQHFTETQRVGKYFFAKISNLQWLHLHFGMTGNLQLFTGKEYPPYTRFVIQFQSGQNLAFSDLRKFGVVQLTPSPEKFCQEQKIGEDLQKITFRDFENGLARRKVAIKTALLSQHHFAGIGNWIADEMLFRARIHPQKLAADCSSKELYLLYQNGQEVVQQAIASDTHYGDFPEGFFARYRKKDALHPDFPHSPVQKLTVGGRGTFIVPQAQQL